MLGTKCSTVVSTQTKGVSKKFGLGLAKGLHSAGVIWLNSLTPCTQRTLTVASEIGNQDIYTSSFWHAYFNIGCCVNM